MAQIGSWCSSPKIKTRNAAVRRVKTPRRDGSGEVHCVLKQSFPHSLSLWHLKVYKGHKLRVKIKNVLAVRAAAEEEPFKGKHGSPGPDKWEKSGLWSLRWERNFFCLFCLNHLQFCCESLRKAQSGMFHYFPVCMKYKNHSTLAGAWRNHYFCPMDSLKTLLHFLHELVFHFKWCFCAPSQCHWMLGESRAWGQHSSERASR